MKFFQSHLGLISTQPEGGFLGFSGRIFFQSHLGLISTFVTDFEFLPVEVLSIPSWSDFNLKQVRYDFINHSSFNPILVWFQQLKAQRARRCGKIFQSHLGLISTNLQSLSACFLQPSFNPILVWFQQADLYLSNPIPKKLSIPSWSDFNFSDSRAMKRENPQSFNPILVWFQRMFRYISFMPNSSFNPILVWFQPNAFSLSMIREDKAFQSHLGLISTETLTASYVADVETFNPILVWFQQIYLTPITSIPYTLSIPSWSDFNACLSNSFFVGSCSLSIPSWSDFNSFYPISISL